MLVEHFGIKQLEQRFAAFNPNKETYVHKQLIKLRSTFRKRVRSAADYKEWFSKSKNGDFAFLDWKKGFELAQSLPSGTVVMYARFSGAPDAVFFFSEQALRKLNDILVQFEKSLEGFEDLVEVQDIMDR